MIGKLYLMIPSVLLIATMNLTGCRPATGPQRHAVGGTVNLDGQPLPQGNLIMQPSDQGLPAASARITQGQFQFSAEDGPGIGEYRIRIEPAFPEFEQFAVEPGSLPSVKKPPIPAKYSDFGTLTAKVTENGLVPDCLQLRSR